MSNAAPEAANDFSDKYHQPEHAAHYWSKHRNNWRGRFRDWWEQRFAAHALSRLGRCTRLLDCPAGVGRFWRTISRNCESFVAVDLSGQMLEEGRRNVPDHAPTDSVVASADDLPFEDGEFDVVFSNRLLHHIADEDSRRAILRSFARVSSRYVVFSTWADGNLSHRRRLRRDLRRGRASTNRFYIPIATIRADIERAGMRVERIQYKARFLSPLVMLTCVVSEGGES